jgi:hypothetical protein
VEGVLDNIPGTGLSVSVEKLVLLKFTPARLTLYWVATGTTSVAGTRNVTRRVLPTTVWIVEAITAADGEPTAEGSGLRFTVISAALIVPDGKLDPVSVTTVEPGVAVAGLAVALRFTCAVSAAAQHSARVQSLRTCFMVGQILALG